jgi:hypothetical protein
VSIIVNPLPQPVITANGPTEICDGSSVTLNTVSSYDSYEWSNGKWGSSLKVKEAGSYFVNVKDKKGCAASSAPLSVIVHDPPEPVITVTGPTAFCKGTFTNLT